jgi:organic radical activating enzyme
MNLESFDKHPNGTIQKNENNLHKLKSRLDSVGQGMCLAKFTQVTMHLGTGLVHSCHHPKAHKIPINGLIDEPERLFNTKVLKNARAEMLNNQKPSECEYCWRIEKTGNLSDRIYKSLENWALEKYIDIVNSNENDVFKPTYLEVSFGNTCNLNCVYCGPEFSSKWVEELKKHGPIKVNDHKGNEQWIQGWQNLDEISIPNREYNPYIEAFWKWFPEIYKDLKHYRITGGEPLLNKNTIKSLDYLIENPRSDLELSINTNLSVPEKVWQDFLKKLKILENKDFKKITVYTSIESWGKKAEYARSNLNVKLLLDRFEELLKLTGVRCVIMSTFNLLSISSFQQLLEWVLTLKNKYNTDDNFRVGIDIPYLRHPECLDAQYCSKELFNDYIYPALQFIKQNLVNFSKTNNHAGFEIYEYNKFERIVNNIQSTIEVYNESTKSNRAKFYHFVNSIDQRRNQNFLETFLEMKEFYNLCKQEVHQ